MLLNFLNSSLLIFLNIDHIPLCIVKTKKKQFYNKPLIVQIVSDSNFQATTTHKTEFKKKLGKLFIIYIL